jgi:hypothetical protein
MIVANRGAHGSWWMAIMQKAYAKTNVAYERIQAGNPVEAFRQLTGMPVITFPTTKIVGGKRVFQNTTLLMY